MVFVTQDFIVCSSDLHQVFPLKFMQFARGFFWVPRLTGRYRLWALFGSKIFIRCKHGLCTEFIQPGGCLRLVLVLFYFPV